MQDLEILCVTMHQTDFSKIKEMNIRTDAVIANQSDIESYKECEFDGYKAKMITTSTRGVGNNRNIALMYASGKYCMLADDDITYYEDMPSVVVSEFEENPDADVMIFHLSTDDQVRKQKKYTRTVKWPFYRGLPWGGSRIAFRLSSVKKANVWFTPLFGGGCLFPSGEDSMFLAELRKAGLKIYVSDKTIGKVSFDTSSWFTGFNKKYYYGKGAFYQAVHPSLKSVFILYMALRTVKKSEISFLDELKWMYHGARGYKDFLSYDDFIKNKR